MAYFGLMSLERSNNFKKEALLLSWLWTANVLHVLKVSEGILIINIWYIVEL